MIHGATIPVAPVAPVELGQGDFYSFDQKFIYYLPTKNVTARKTILTSILSIAFVTE